MNSKPHAPEAPATVTEEQASVQRAPGEGWAVILYNDDHNEMTYVALLLNKATGFDIEQCCEIMMAAHTNGKAIVTITEKVRAERIVSVLKTGGLTAEIRAM